MKAILHAEGWMTPQEAAAATGLSETNIHLKIKNGKLHAERVATFWWVSIKDLIDRHPLLEKPIQDYVAKLREQEKE